MTDASAVMARPPAPRRLETVVIFLLTVAVVLHVGGLAIGAHQLVNWDGLSALAHAVDVLYREPMVNLALIGFAEPPATPLLYLPLAALLPDLSYAGHVTCILGALLLGWCAVLLNGLAVRIGLPWWVRYPAVAVLVLHPVSLSYAALGSPMVLLLMATLGMANSMAAWGEQRHLRDLIACSCYATIALLTRYEAVFVVAAAALYIATSGPGPTPGRYSRIEGLLITFLLPVVYFGGLWLVASWLIMGDPWHSLTVTFAGVESVPQHWSSGVLMTALLVFPLSYALAYHELRPPGPWGAGAGPALLMAAAVAAPLLWPRLHVALGEENAASWWPSLAAMSVTVLATSLVLAVMVTSQYLGTRHTEANNSHRPVGGTVLLALAGVFIVVGMRPAGMALPAGPGTVLRGHVAFAHSTRAEQQVAEIVADEVEAGRQVVIAGWPGFAIALYSGAVGSVRVLAEERPDAQLAGELRPGDLLVLLGGEQLWAQALADHAIAREWSVGAWRGVRVIEPVPPSDAPLQSPGQPSMR